MGRIVQYHGAEKEEATGDGAMGKEEDLVEKKIFKLGDKVWVSILSFLGNFSSTNLGSGSSQFSGFLYSVFVTLKGIEQGVISPGPFPCHPRG